MIELKKARSYFAISWNVFFKNLLLKEHSNNNSLKKLTDNLSTIKKPLTKNTI